MILDSRRPVWVLHYPSPLHHNHHHHPKLLSLSHLIRSLSDYPFYHLPPVKYDHTNSSFVAAVQDNAAAPLSIHPHPFRNWRFAMDEAGRCRRTDGKKWRCSKAVIPNQKYCEKHMHRGCRSRKHVESSTDQSKSANGKTVEDNNKEGSNGSVTKIVIKSAVKPGKNKQNGTRVKDDDGSRAPQTNDTGAEREDSELRRSRKADKKRGQCGEDEKQCKKLMQ